MGQQAIQFDGLEVEVRTSAPERSIVDGRLDELDEVNRKILDGLLRDRSVSPHRLERRLRERGFPLSHNAITRWRDLNGVSE